MTSSLPQLDVSLIKAFIQNREWVLSSSNEKFEKFAPPKELGLPDNFRLTLPKDNSAIDTNTFLERIVSTLSIVYDIPEQNLNILFSSGDLVFSVRQKSPQTEAGLIPLLNMDVTIQKFRQILINAAAFVFSNKYKLESIPLEVSTYLNKCNFLQTSTGSFVTNIQLPSKLNLKSNEVFEKNGFGSDEVNSTLFNIIEFVIDHPLNGDKSIFNEENMLENYKIINIDIMQNILDFINKTSVHEVDFKFLSIEKSKSLSTGRLKDLNKHNLNQYIEFVNNNIVEDIDVCLEGKVVELKSKNPNSNSNQIVISSRLDNKKVSIAATLSNEQYSIAINAHQFKKMVRIEGKAKKLKRKIKVITLEFFNVLG